MADYGFVYCMGNDCMPGVFKIGKTSRSVLVRAQELSSSTSVPTDFDVLFYIEIPNMSQMEADLHEEYDDYRVSSNREFFSASIEDIWNSFECLVEDEGLPMAITNKGKGLLAMAEFERQERQRAPAKEYGFEKWIAKEKQSDESVSESIGFSRD